jgi:Nucleotidyl transferase AbiEii toxin, Type IV TA system
MQSSYSHETALLVKSLPAVAEEECFALHGGTAINLFYENLPRLSVDIDLTYIPIENRQISLRNITAGLSRISNRLKSSIGSSQIQLKEDVSKLIVTSNHVSIKIEVNQTKRGILLPCSVLSLCPKARELYSSYSEIKVVEKGLLYGGKICAALDRQHPRDLFDIMVLLSNSGITENIKEGFFLCLLSSDRPVHEILYPNLLDQRNTLENKFDGMTEQTFTYEDFEITRQKLLNHLYSQITHEDKQFLIDFESGKPDWSCYDFSRFPGIHWKQLNIQKLTKTNPNKHSKLLKILTEKMNRGVESL